MTMNTSANTSSPMPDQVRAEAVIDLAAVAANIERLRASSSADVMVVVKADGYGHGDVAIARHARDIGVSWLGVALPAEALALRDAGDEGSILAWLLTPGQGDTVDCVMRDVDLGVSDVWALEEIAGIGRDTGMMPRVHLKVDTGLGRGGVAWTKWPEFVRRARVLRDEGVLDVVGVWSHLASGEQPDSEITAAQARVFADALEVVDDAGLQPRWIHLANSGAVLNGSENSWGFEQTLVRCGIATYGITPGLALGDSAALGLRPAMTLQARLAVVKEVPAGHGVSYGHLWTAAAPTVLGLLPLGYADGLPRTARNPEVLVEGRRRPIIGRIAMDQCVLDLGAPDEVGDIEAGTAVTVFGPGAKGEPTAEDWAGWADTIGYEIVTRIGPRVPRRYVEETRA